MPCFPASLQAPVKSYLRPGTWMPGLRSHHCHTENWKINGDPSHCIEETVIAIEHLNEVEHPSEYYVNRISHDENWVQIFCYTPAGWLDVMELTFVSCGLDSSLVTVSSFSTGALPAWFPLGFLCDVALCWCPIVGGGNNITRCQIVRESLPFVVDLLDQNESDLLIPKQNRQKQGLSFNSLNEQIAKKCS